MSWQLTAIGFCLFALLGGVFGYTVAMVRDQERRITEIENRQSPEQYN